MKISSLQKPSSNKLHYSILITLGLLTTSFTNSQTQKVLTENVVKNPSEAIFVYQDIENFVDAQQAIASGKDTSEALKSRYLDKASPGLKMFISKYDLTIERLRRAIKNYSDDYSNVAEKLTALKNHEASYKEYYAKIKNVVPNAVFPPTYFVIAGHRGIGSGSTEGPLISIEKKTIKSIKEMQGTLVHEMIHMQQLAATGEAYFAIFSGKERTLLATSIREGGATYMAELIAGGSKHKNLARDYYLANENKFWEKFSKSIMAVTDYPGFLKLSRYAEKFIQKTD
ncbi:MAG: hypothetical protein D8M58_07795 [Calditrichaeota bacterium]|nr:MAG: hypothetical protein DWQ03_18695 [Calditrichota bacterium]MBL1205283.1 hypothetical protein [Calditrichota bacterium]NOG45112.1 hypothetical protein [Calditrichota bacterium]